MEHTDSFTDQQTETGAWYPQRSGLRYPFTASIKVVEPNSGKQVIAITSNLSRCGCHVRTSTTFQPGVKIKVTITHQDRTFESDGEVVYAIPGAGMGLRFENSEFAEDVALNGWLMQASEEVLEGVRESTDMIASRKQRIVLILCIVALAAIVGGVLVWAAVLR